MSDVYERVAEPAAMVISRDDDAYAIMARKRVRAIAGSETPTIDHYREALEQCIADKAEDWRAACEAAAAASKEVARLRLTDAEREAIANGIYLCEGESGEANENINANAWAKTAGVLRGLLKRLGGGA